MRVRAAVPHAVLDPVGAVFAELKAEAGKLSAWQETWLQGLRATGAEAYCWRPSDWAELEGVLRR